MFTFKKKDKKLLVQKSNLIENQALKNVVLKLDQNNLGGFAGYRELVYERYIFEKVIHELPGDQ